MVRLVAFNVIFFLLPFGIYAGWLLATRGTVGGASDWPVRTITWLFTQFDRSPPGGKYVPAEIIDGVLVPGHFE
jgi:hypothetical protein